MEKKSQRLISQAINKLQRGRYKEADELLSRLAGRHCQSPEVKSLAGVCKMELGQMDKAVKLFRQVLQRIPGHVPSLYNLARTLQMNGQHDEAESCYVQLTRLAPDFFHAWNNLGLIYRETGRLEQAKRALEKALSIAPEHAPCLNNLAVVVEGLGRLDKARALFEKAISIDDKYLSAHFNLGCLLFRLGKFQEAEKHLSWVLSENENEPTARFLLQSMGKLAPPRRAPTGYIKKTFDDWAEQFDYRLVKELAYNTPKKLFDFLKPHLRNSIDILDLGCGTGLGAEFYRPFALFLAGMDCSEKMLQKAREKRLYDALYQHDIEKKWPTHKKFHLIYSSDCLCYFGDLAMVFRRVRHGLCPEGIFGFSVEMALESEDASEGYMLRKTGRYVHTISYIEDTLKKTGMKPVKIERVNLRKEADKWIKGLLFVAQYPKS